MLTSVWKCSDIRTGGENNGVDGTDLRIDLGGRGVFRLGVINSIRMFVKTCSAAEHEHPLSTPKNNLLVDFRLSMVHVCIVPMANGKSQ